MLFAAFVAFLLVGAVIRLLHRRADRARGMVHARVERFLEG